MRYQHTIADPVVVEGFGYWSGRDVRVEFRPAAEGQGVIFERTDLRPSLRIAARVEHCIETPRRTTLAHGEQRVEMVEHILAALAGLGIDNCLVRASAAEMPGFDGSSAVFVEALQSAGRVRQNAPRRQLVVTRPVRVGNPESWVEARPAAHGGCEISYELDYGDGPIGRQHFSLELSPERFARELAPARTFLLEEEARWLQQQGLAQRVTYQDVLVFGRSGVIGNQLRFADECVRHKALDLVGDLALSGCELVGRFHAYRSGHRLNAELVRQLLACEQQLEGNRQIA